MDHIDRIRAMERILNEGGGAVAQLFRDLERLEAIEEELKELFAYYGSAEWFAHRERDGRGELPQDLPRGVLTEDAVYDLLTDLARLKAETQTLYDRLLREEQVAPE